MVKKTNPGSGNLRLNNSMGRLNSWIQTLNKKQLRHGVFKTFRQNRV